SALCERRHQAKAHRDVVRAGVVRRRAGRPRRPARHARSRRRVAATQSSGHDPPESPRRHDGLRCRDIKLPNSPMKPMRLHMNKIPFLAALATLVLALPAFAEKPQVRSYAAGAINGGIPLWNPSEKFVAIASGSCS